MYPCKRPSENVLRMFFKVHVSVCSTGRKVWKALIK